MILRLKDNKVPGMEVLNFSVETVNCLHDFTKSGVIVVVNSIPVLHFCEDGKVYNCGISDDDLKSLGCLNVKKIYSEEFKGIRLNNSNWQLNIIDL